ncbi:MAG TPA: DNA polymerase III subunit delta' [Gemmataceae bacterium]|nr:DNA polymerase III subunit delta' [Gemmataceae bacterium]
MSWKRVRGHEAQALAFERAVRRNRLAHAYLFVGPPGVGKRLFAQELAKALLCEGDTGGRFEACDRCAACALVEAGTHPDCFMAARPEERHELPIEVMRELCRAFALRPARGRGKVAILDDADDLNEEAANCFLKTLEEPPPRSVLILVGSSRERQLATIVSRCQVVRFAPLSEELVAEVLRGQEIEDAGSVERLARLSGGSPGQALALADPALWAFRRTLLEGLARPRPDSVALGEALTQFVEEAGKDSSAQRRRAGLVLRLLIEFLDDALRLRVGGEPRLAEEGDRPLLQALAERADPERLLEVLERCLEGDAQIDRRVQLVLALEALTDALGQQLKCESPR